MFTHKLTLYVAPLTIALVPVYTCGCVVNDVLCVRVCGSGFGPRSFVIVTLSKVFVLSDGRDTEEAKMEST